MVTTLSTRFNSAAGLLMVPPATFGFDEQTALSNSFQHAPVEGADHVQQQAMREFSDLVNLLRSYDIQVFVPEIDNRAPARPNAVFTNNWLSTWPTGEVYLYPMATESRRAERDLGIIRQLAERFVVDKIIDLSAKESQGVFLESTGVMVFDHLNGLVYACPSSRCDISLLRKHVETLGYEAVVFEANDRTGHEMYHTNVMLAIQSTTAIVCEAAIDPSHRESTLQRLRQTGREVVTIDFDQLDAFAANALEVQNRFGESFLVMSQGALDSLDKTQRRTLEASNEILASPLHTIESVGGGSARCMLAEIFLPLRSSNRQGDSGAQTDDLLTA
jgi:hypothetical protein